jgi:hypothetical protein
MKLIEKWSNDENAGSLYWVVYELYQRDNGSYFVDCEGGPGTMFNKKQRFDLTPEEVEEFKNNHSVKTILEQR